MIAEIFISYSWKNENIADSLESMFTDKNVKLLRDKRDLTFRKSIKEYMKTIRNVDYCIMIISDSFLKSKNCMYEVNEFIKDENYKNKILPLIEKETNIFSAIERNKYIKYWQEEYEKLDEDSEKIEILNKNDSISELKMLENIKRNIGDFLNNISDLKAILFDTGISISDFQNIMSIISPEEYQSPYSNIEGYFLLNVPRTIKEKTFIWWKKDSKGYTTDINEARIFSKSEILKIISDDWDNKKYAAIPIKEVASKLGQTYIPYHYKFIKIIKDNHNLVIGNKNLYLTEDEVRNYM